MTTTQTNLPGNAVIPSMQNGLTTYFERIKKFPLLSREEETDLARRYQNDGDLQAAHKLVTSHLRLSARMALGYRHYGLSVQDLISEGNVGLMQAVKKFDPEKGNRLSTYAMWWIRAALNQYVLSSWSMVKMGTVAAQKKLFFNLRKMKARLGIYNNSQLDNEVVTDIADTLDVSESEVVQMNGRIGRDSSLNRPVSEEWDIEQQDILTDEMPNQEEMLGDSEEYNYRRSLLDGAMESLSGRERDIIHSRRISEEPETLEDLGSRYGISRERVRQIENRAFQKLSADVRQRAAAA